MKRQIHSRSYLKDYRTELRRNLTPAEAVLWTAIKNSQVQGRKFRRQHSICNYIVDFYCAEERLVIELDGQGHYEHGAVYADGDRDERLMGLGFTVLRFENKEVLEQIENVLIEIRNHFKDRN